MPQTTELYSTPSANVEASIASSEERDDALDMINEVQQAHENKWKAKSIYEPSLLKKRSFKQSGQG
jgi:hypothetical protein